MVLLISQLMDGKYIKGFKYLGSVITEDRRSRSDVKTRIAMAKVAFNKRKELLTKELTMKLKTRMVKVLVWPVVLYGCETWTLLQDEINRLQALEMWLWSGLKKIRWSDRISHDEVLTIVNEKGFLIKTITKRKKN